VLKKERLKAGSTEPWKPLENSLSEKKGIIMNEQKLKKLLADLAERTTEPVRPTLAEDIKQHIPQNLHHKRGMDTVNIIIDLRISKYATAAVIIIVLILMANFFSTQHSAENNILQDSRMLFNYVLGGSNTDRTDVIKSLLNKYNELVNTGKEAVYYGENLAPDNNDALLMQWKLDDGKYMVIFNDLRVKAVDAEELIKLQAQMLQNKANF
jgi:hypothetical protein